MPILEITLNPNPLLRKKLGAVRDISYQGIPQLVADMRATMVAAQGIGLAANQVGRDFRIFTVDKALAEKAGVPDVFINPVIQSESEKTSRMEEGCLSIPGKFDEVRRPSEVTLSAVDKNGKPFLVKASGLLSRVLQHEIDHLNGILFVDRINK